MNAIASCTDAGPRPNLEDASRAVVLRFCGTSEIALGTLADGVGGEQYGEVASAMAIQNITAFVAASLAAVQADTNRHTADEMLALLRQAFAQANQVILKAATAEPACKGMATTAVCFLARDGELFVAWKGDSRCYLWVGGALRRLTRDHSDAQDLIDAGVLSPDAAKDHPCAHVINRYLGQSRDVAAQTVTCPIPEGAVVLACSDGLTDVVPDAQIAELIGDYKSGLFSFEELPNQLVRRAVAQGTQDNVTVLCCEYGSAVNRSGVGFDRTRTGAYPVAMAAAIRELNQEACYVPRRIAQRPGRCPSPAAASGRAGR